MNASSCNSPVVHYAKVDWWIAVLLGAAIVLTFTVATTAGIGALNGDEPGVAIGVGAVNLAGAMFVGFCLWSCYHIRYEITLSDLVVRCWPIRISVELNTIVEVLPTNNPISAMAPSMDRLKVKYRSTSGTRGLLISPKDKEGFLRDLASAAPHLQSTGLALHLKAEKPA